MFGSDDHGGNKNFEMVSINMNVFDFESTNGRWNTYSYNYIFHTFFEIIQTMTMTMIVMHSGKKLFIGDATTLC